MRMNKQAGKRSVKGGMDFKARAKALKADIPAVFLSLKDGQTPFIAKVLAFLTVAYALSPIDLIPDFIPVLGYLDDVLILPLMVALTIRLIPKDVWARNRAAAEHLWENGRPKRWIYAVPIVLFWALILFLIARAVLKNI